MTGMTCVLWLAAECRTLISIHKAIRRSKTRRHDQSSGNQAPMRALP